jgi:hypothetical protein
MEKKRGEFMEYVTAYSTLALAVLTLALVILAAANLNKFIENISLINKSIEEQGKSIKLQADGLDLQSRSINLQADALKEQSKAIELQAHSLKIQANSVDLQNKDIRLNYKPVVFIKGVLAPQTPKDSEDPYKYGFILTNSGKLPARDVKVIFKTSFITDNITAIDNFQPNLILENASLYPDSDLVIWVPPFIENLTNLKKLEINFIIIYKGDGLEGEIKEEMRFINTQETNHQWTYVGPDFDIFATERKSIKLNDKRSKEEKAAGKKFLEEHLKKEYPLGFPEHIKVWLDNMQ